MSSRVTDPLPGEPQSAQILSILCTDSSSEHLASIQFLLREGSVVPDVQKSALERMVRINSPAVY